MKFPDKIFDQMKKAGLPQSGPSPYIPKIATNRRGENIVVKDTIAKGPKKEREGTSIISAEYGSKTGHTAATRTIGTYKSMAEKITFV